MSEAGAWCSRRTGLHMAKSSFRRVAHGVTIIDDHAVPLPPPPWEEHHHQVKYTPHAQNPGLALWQPYLCKIL